MVFHSCDGHMTLPLCMCREYHSRVVTAKREKQSELKVDGDTSLNETSQLQEPSTIDDLAGFQTSDSRKKSKTMTMLILSSCG